MPLNKAVRGLSDLLGQYSGGTVPLEASPWVEPSYDILPFLVPPKWAFNTNSAGAAPRAASVIVPDGEMWLVNALFSHVEPPVAADAIWIYPFWAPAVAVGAFIEYAIGDDGASRYLNPTTGGTQGQGGTSKVFHRPFMMNSGERIGVQVTGQVSAGNIDVNVAVQYHQIKI